MWIECPECGGSGHGPTYPTCCGNVNSVGECRAHCAIPAVDPCEMCGGNGGMETDEPSVSDGGSGA